MPLGRYFVFVGSILLALLFLADWYMPQLAATPARAEVNRSIIRLHSRHRWPERIVIDTSLPTIVPPPARIVEAAPVKPATVARSPREAFALITPAQAGAPATASKAKSKRRARTARSGGRIANSETTGSHNPFPALWERHLE